MSLFDNRMSRFRGTTSISSRLGVTTSDSVNRKRVNVLDFWILLQRLDAERAVSRLQQQVLFFPSPFNLFSYSLSITFVASDIVFLRVSFSFSFRNWQNSALQTYTTCIASAPPTTTRRRQTTLEDISARSFAEGVSRQVGRQHQQAILYFVLESGVIVLARIFAGSFLGQR